MSRAPDEEEEGNTERAYEALRSLALAGSLKKGGGAGLYQSTDDLLYARVVGNDDIEISSTKGPIEHVRLPRDFDREQIQNLVWSRMEGLAKEGPKGDDIFGESPPDYADVRRKGNDTVGLSSEGTEIGPNSTLLTERNKYTLPGTNIPINGPQCPGPQYPGPQYPGADPPTGAMHSPPLPAGFSPVPDPDADIYPPNPVQRNGPHRGLKGPFNDNSANQFHWR